MVGFPESRSVIWRRRRWEAQIEGVLLGVDQEGGYNGRGYLGWFDGDGFGKRGDGSVGVGWTGRIPSVGQRLGGYDEVESLVRLTGGGLLRTRRTHRRLLVSGRARRGAGRRVSSTARVGGLRLG